MRGAVKISQTINSLKSNKEHNNKHAKHEQYTSRLSQRHLKTHTQRTQGQSFTCCDAPEPIR